MQIHSEKKAIKKVRKTLSNFDSRIISNVRASPAAFARILTNELLYQDFRFDFHAQKESQSKQEQERIEKSQNLNDSRYKQIESKSGGDIESRQSKYKENDQSIALKQDNIKIISIYDRTNKRFILCEKTYEIQKYYVLHIDEKRPQNCLQNLVQITQYVTFQVNIGTKQYGRGKRGIEVDLREFMALRNLVHLYSPDPFATKASKQDIG